MEIETAARRHLLSLPSIAGYVGQKVYKFSLLDHVDGTGGRALVVRRDTGWSAPPTIGRAEYPQLVVECWADCSRTPDGETLAADAIDNAYALYRAVNEKLHTVRDQIWGAGGASKGVRVFSCVRTSEPFHMTATDSHGSGSSTTTPRGDSAVVIASYSLHI